jgi:hypothetical protein
MNLIDTMCPEDVERDILAFFNPTPEDVWTEGWHYLASQEFADDYLTMQEDVTKFLFPGDLEAYLFLSDYKRAKDDVFIMHAAKEYQKKVFALEDHQYFKELTTFGVVSFAKNKLKFMQLVALWLLYLKDSGFDYRQHLQPRVLNAYVLFPELRKDQPKPKAKKRTYQEVAEVTPVKKFHSYSTV